MKDGDFVFGSLTDQYNDILTAGAESAMTERRFFERSIVLWMQSIERQNQIVGERYYRGRHDIFDRERTVIGKDGKVQTVNNIPNNKIVDNQYGKMVDQKNNYLLGKPFNLQTDNEAYAQALSEIFNRRFHRLFKNLGEDSLNGGIGWLYVYYDPDGAFRFQRFAPFEILPFWKDADHTVLDCAVRWYNVEVYEGEELKTIEKVEIYKKTGIERYVLVDDTLVDDIENPSSPYMTIGGKAFNWERVPIVGFKYNDEEIPLICKVKSLQDALNTTISDFQNNMQEDSRNTILVIKNYDGQNLADFRYNLAAYGAVKVKSGGVDSNGGKYGDGGVDTLQVEVNAENYRSLIELFKKSLIENAMGFDAKDDRMSGKPNQMNILSMYSDIELDAHGMETEYQASFEDLLYFVDAHLANTGKGHFQDVDVDVIFNRDMLMNEKDIIDNIRNSIGILSDETLVSNHPWVTDLNAELKRLQDEKEATTREQVDVYTEAFPKEQTTDTG